MESILAEAFGAFNKYSGWIVWNLFLAFIPLMLSFWLFLKRSKKRSLLWWIGLIIFIVFLPNAPYLLTDIIHLIGKFVFTSELLTHALAAIGIFLGRFRRFNSWDLVTKPDILFMSTISDLTTKEPLLVIAITFIILVILYWLTKQITLGTLWRIKFFLYSLDPDNKAK